jgi:quercetin dioxygenase-like cupin family protein
MNAKSIRIQARWLVLTLIFCSSVGLASEPAISHAMNSNSLTWGPCPPPFSEGCEIAVLHGDISKPNADVFFKVPGNYDLPAHWHNSAERMILVAGSMNVNYPGQGVTELKTGMYAYGPAKAVHDGRCVSDGPCVVFIAFEAPVDTMEYASPTD